MIIRVNVIVIAIVIVIIIIMVISLVRERNGGRGSFAATLLNPNVEHEGHSHTGPLYFETI